MDFALPSDELLTSPALRDPIVELEWRTEIEADRLSEVELDLLAPILPELIGELMMTRDWTEAE
jgi:hypothetical protein